MCRGSLSCARFFLFSFRIFEKEEEFVIAHAEKSKEDRQSEKEGTAEAQDE